MQESTTDIIKTCPDCNQPLTIYPESVSDQVKEALAEISQYNVHITNLQTVINSGCSKEDERVKITEIIPKSYLDSERQHLQRLRRDIEQSSKPEAYMRILHLTSLEDIQPRNALRWQEYYQEEIQWTENLIKGLVTDGKDRVYAICGACGYSRSSL